LTLPLQAARVSDNISARVSAVSFFILFVLQFFVCGEARLFHKHHFKILKHHRHSLRKLIAQVFAVLGEEMPVTLLPRLQGIVLTLTLAFANVICDVFSDSDS